MDLFVRILANRLTRRLAWVLYLVPRSLREDTGKWIVMAKTAHGTKELFMSWAAGVYVRTLQATFGVLRDITFLARLGFVGPRDPAYMDVDSKHAMDPAKLVIDEDEFETKYGAPVAKVNDKLSSSSKASKAASSSSIGGHDGAQSSDTKNLNRKPLAPDGGAKSKARAKALAPPGCSIVEETKWHSRWRLNMPHKDSPHTAIPRASSPTTAARITITR